VNGYVNKFAVYLKG